MRVLHHARKSKVNKLQLGLSWHFGVSATTVFGPGVKWPSAFAQDLIGGVDGPRDSRNRPGLCTVRQILSSASRDMPLDGAV